MSREFFRVEQDDDGRKSVVWEAWMYVGEDGCRLEEACCEVYLDEVSEWGLKEDLILELEQVTQYLTLLSDEEFDELWDGYYEDEPMSYLTFDEVDEDTPVGNYYFDDGD